MKSILRKTFVFLIFTCIPFMVYASQSGSGLHVEFEKEITTAVGKILKDSQIENWSMALALFLTFICVFIGLYKFTRDGDLLDVFVTAILFISFLALFTVYGTVVDTIYGACVQLGDTMYSAAIGGETEDVILDSFIKAVSLPSTGIFDAIDLIIMSFFWYICIAFLSLAIYFAEIWLVVGLAIAKVAGVLFIPFMIASWTQGIFTRWVNFFMLWGVSVLFLKITSIVTMVIMKASLNAVANKKNIGDIVGSDFTVSKTIEMGEDNLLLMIALCTFTIVAALMIFGSFKLAAQCLGTGGSAGSGLNNGAVRIAKKVMVFF